MTAASEERRESHLTSAAARVTDVLTGSHGRLVLFLFLLLLFGATTTRGLEVVNDVRSSSAAAWVLAEHGTLDFEVAGIHDVSWTSEGTGGQSYSNRFPGNYLPAVPAYVLAPDTVTEDAGGLGIPVWPASLTAAALVAGALVVLRDVMREEFGEPRALGVTLVAGLGTSVWTVAADALWTHSSGVLVLALAMRAVQRERYVVAGGWLAYAITVRPTHAFTALGVGVGLALGHRAWRRLAQIGVPAALGLGAMSVYTRLLFGSWFPVAGYADHRVTGILGASEALTGPFTFWQQITGTFLDGYHGILPYSPFLLLCFALIIPAWRSSPSWARALAFGGALYWMAQLRGNPWPGGYNFFGYRFPIEPLWCASVVLAHGWFLAIANRWGRMAGIVLVTVALTVNSIGAVMFGARYEPNRPGYERVGPAFSQ